MQENKTKNLLSKPKTLFKFRVRNKKTHNIRIQSILKAISRTLYKFAKRSREKVRKIKKQNHKLISNAVFAKSIENPMSKVDVKVVTTREQYLKWSFRPTYKRGKKIIMKQ